MFGSKTTRLFAVLDRYKYQKRKIIAFKPSIDARYSKTKISTHSGASMPAMTQEVVGYPLQICFHLVVFD